MSALCAVLWLSLISVVSAGADGEFSVRSIIIDDEIITESAVMDNAEGYVRKTGMKKRCDPLSEDIIFVVWHNEKRDGIGVAAGRRINNIPACGDCRVIACIILTKNIRILRQKSIWFAWATPWLIQPQFESSFVKGDPHSRLSSRITEGDAHEDIIAGRQWSSEDGFTRRDPCSPAKAISAIGDIGASFSGVGKPMGFDRRAEHFVAEPVGGRYRLIGSAEGEDRIIVLTTSALAHLTKHPEIDDSERQRPHCQKDGSISGAPIMVATTPPSLRPTERAPDTPSNLAKGLVIVAVALICAVLMWFGVPALFIGIDQGSFLLFAGGILAIVLLSAAILYGIDFCLF